MYDVEVAITLLAVTDILLTHFILIFNKFAFFANWHENVPSNIGILNDIKITSVIFNFLWLFFKISVLPDSNKIPQIFLDT